jgi:hypothetical protein
MTRSIKALMERTLFKGIIIQLRLLRIMKWVVVIHFMFFSFAQFDFHTPNFFEFSSLQAKRTYKKKKWKKKSKRTPRPTAKPKKRQWKPKKKRLKSRCPKGMVLVRSKKRSINVCVDIFELSYPGKKKITQVKPHARQNLASCMRRCRQQGKRLLNDREWKVACEGTRPRYCNIYRSHPILRMVKSKKSWRKKGKNCKGKRARWSKVCMNDARINKQSKSLATNMLFSKCVSKYGVRNMVGNLGEWVAGKFYRRKSLRGRFNGGLYPQRKSSCSYETIAHGPEYYDYSIGCRCGRNPY